MKRKQYRIISNCDKTLFVAQEKQFTFFQKILNFFLRKERFFYWKDVMMPHESNTVVKCYIRILEKKNRDSDRSTWIEYES